MDKIKKNMHIIEADEGYIGFDVTTLKFFYLDQKCVDLIRGNKLSDEDKEKILEELDYYTQRGYFNDLGMPKSTEDFLTTYNVSIQNTLLCPLNCKYCFSKKIKAEEQNMSAQTATATVNFIFEYFKENVDHYELYFTSGGEPLCNFPIIKMVYSLAKKKAGEFGKSLRTGFTTNTLLLDNEKIKYLEDNEIGIAISIDGNKKEHNHNRQLNSGGDSHNYIINIMPKLLQSESGYLNRPLAFTVLTPEREDYISIIKYLVDLGFYKTNLKIIRNIDPDNPFIRTQDLGKIKKNYRKLIDFLRTEIMENRWKHFRAILDYNNMLGQFMLNILLKRKTLYRCDAGKTKFSITPDGDIYPCDYFSLLPETKMGNVYSGISEGKRKEWMEMTGLAFAECKLCWARYLCSGGCYYGRYINNGKADYVECELNKFLIEEIVKMFYKINKERKNVYRHLKYLAREIAKISNYE